MAVSVYHLCSSPALGHSRHSINIHELVNIHEQTGLHFAKYLTMYVVNMMKALYDQLTFDNGTFVCGVRWGLWAFLLVIIGLEGEQIQK